MQLILETKNPSIDINEKMSTLDEGALNEKPLQNGDVKEVVEEVNGKIKTDGTSDKENIQIEENILNNTFGIDSHKEAGDNFISTEKSLEVCTSIEENTMSVEKETHLPTETVNGQDKLEKEENEQPGLGELKLDKTQELNLNDKEIPQLEDVQKQDFDDKSLVQFKENKKTDPQEKLQLEENKETDMDTQEEQELDKAKEKLSLKDNKETVMNTQEKQEFVEAQEKLLLKENKHTEMDTQEEQELDEAQEKLLLKENKETEMDTQEEQELDIAQEKLSLQENKEKVTNTQEKQELDEAQEKLLLKDNKETEMDTQEKQELNKAQEKLSLQENKETVMNTQEKQKLDEAQEKLLLKENKETEMDTQEKQELNKAQEKLSLQENKETVMNTQEKQELDEAQEKLLLKENDETETDTQEKQELDKAQEKSSLQENKETQEKLGFDEAEEKPLLQENKETELDTPEMQDLDKVQEKSILEENKEPEMDTQEKPELNENRPQELDKNDQVELELEETEKLELDEKEELNTNVSMIQSSSSTNSKPAKIDPPEHEEPQNIIAHEKEDSLKREKLVSSAEENVVPMEVACMDNNTIEQDIDDFSEKDVTQSISNMVENIVQNLNEDIADDSFSNIEMDDNEILEDNSNVENNIAQNMNEENVAIELIDKTETNIIELVQKYESKSVEISIEPEIISNIEDQNKKESVIEPELNIEEEQNKMEVDEEPDTNAISEVPVQPNNELIDSEREEFTEPEFTTNSDQVPLPISKVTEASQKSLESESDIVNLSEKSAVEQKSIKSDMNLETSVLELSVDNIAHDDVTATIVKETEKANVNEADSTQVIELKSSDSSINNLDDNDSSISEIQDDIISFPFSNIEKVPETADKNVSESPDKQNHVPSDTVSEAKDDTYNVEEVKTNKETKSISEQKKQNERTPEKVSTEKSHTPLIKLSNTMDILSDEEDDPITEEPPKADFQNKMTDSSEKQCIDLVDDDDIMLIDDDTNKEDKTESRPEEPTVDKIDELQFKKDEVMKPKDSENKTTEITAEAEKESTKPETEVKVDLPSQAEAASEPLETVPKKHKPLIIPQDFFKTYRKNLADMTRDDLEEFCILKIVESIIDRSNLNEIRSKLKSMGQTIEEYKKKAMMLTKQNRDLQVVLKSVQEEQKKSTGNQPITPLKITRSVGMQVLMTDKTRRRIMPASVPGSTGNIANNANQVNNRNIRIPTQSPRTTPQKVVNNQPIPVPRLVPASSNVVNKPVSVIPANNITKATAVQNGVKNTSPAQKPEKRTHSRMQSQSSSVTVDLTDDEPPSKVPTKTSPAPPVRLVNPQNLLAPRQQFSQQVNSPRKVYIPISLNGPQAQAVRPGQTIMLKTVSAQGPRPRGPAPTVVRAPQNVMRRIGTRHPAPLPDAMKQYQPPNWKALPPAPDLKLSKVENGIVISWKIEGYQEDSYEEIASYQLYAYQETSAPASTALWKKIGDVKALPLPMACTLTQFMAGYKYYFAVRAVDVRSRLGPFSLPGSILLLNKM